MTQPAAEVLGLSDLVWGVLSAIPGVNAFDGEFVDADGKRVSPPLDQDGRVHAYAVFYPGPGDSTAMTACGTPDTLAWGFQVTCVGGDRTRALWCVQQVRDAVTGRRITVAGQGLVITEVPGAAGRRLSRDDDVSPARFYTPLDFQVTA